MADWFRDELLRGHPLWMSPEWAAPAGHPGADAATWVELCRRAGVTSLLFVCKQQDGQCVYPTRLDAPSIELDLLRDITTLGGQAGIRIVAYYCVGIDTAQVDRHPDWAFRDAAGKPSYAYGAYWTCLNSPYRDFALAQLEEICAGYPVDCLWLDIFALGRPRQDCLCDYCRAKYARAHAGADLAAIAGTRAAGEWKIDCLEEFLVDTRKLLARHRPEALLGFNGAGPGFRRHPEAGAAGRRLLPHVDFLSEEGHNPLRQTSLAKYFRSRGARFEILTPNTLPTAVAGSWIGWVIKPSSLLTLEAATIAAHGGTCGVGLSVHPDGSLAAGELATVGETGRWLEARREHLRDQTAMAEVALLCQPFETGLYPDAYRPPEAPPIPPLPQSGAREYQGPRRDAYGGGLEVALLEAHVQYTLADDDFDPTGYRVVVLPGDAHVDAALAERLRAFVAAGGALLAEWHAGLLGPDRERLPDFVLGDVLGIRFEGYAGSWDANYLRVDAGPLAAGIPYYPLQIVGPAVRVGLTGAAALATIVSPLGGMRTLERHMASRFNPPGPDTGFPAITSHRYGRGHAIYVAPALGEHIQARREIDPWPKQLVANLLDLLLPDPLLRTSAPAGVETLLNRQGDRYVVHLLNRYVESSALSARRDAPAIAGIEVALNAARLGRIGSAAVAPTGEPLPVRREAGWATVAVPPVSIASTVTFATADPQSPPAAPTAPGADGR